jgi:antitoxin ParD1/3/4
MFEYEEKKKLELITELKKGEDSGFNQNFNRDCFIKDLHKNQ